MRGLCALVCLCWLLANVGQTVQTLTEAAGRSLWYRVESSVLAGIPEIADQYSGISLDYDLLVHVVNKNKALFKIQNVRAGKINEEVPGSYEEDVPFQRTPSPVYERELSKPFSAFFQDAQVTKFVAQKSDPDWSVNIKKSLADKFQVDLEKYSTSSPPSSSNRRPQSEPSPFYTIFEEGIGGDCETRYSVQSVQSLDHPDQSPDVLNVTKVKNFRNCRSRPISDWDNFEFQGSPIVCDPMYAPLTKKQPSIWRESSSVYDSGCHFGFEPDFSPVKSYSIVWYNISRASSTPIIEGIQAEGKTVYYLTGKELLVVAQLNITLIKDRSLPSSVPEVPNPVTHDSLEFQLPTEDYLDSPDSSLYAIYGSVHPPDLTEAVDRQLDSVVDAIIPDEPESSEDVSPKIIQLVRAFSVMKHPELETVFKQVESDNEQKVDRKQSLKKKIILDIMAIAATDSCALFARDLFTSQRIKPWEAAELFEGIGKNVDEPSTEVIEAYIELLEKPRIQTSRRLFPAVAITIGKMVKESCVNDSDPLPPQQLKEYRQSQPHGPRHPRSLKPYSPDDHQQPWKQSKKTKAQQPEDKDECSRQQLQSYIKVMAQKLRNASKISKMISHIEALTHMGTPDVLPYLKPYVTGEAPSLDPLEDEDADFVQAAAIYALSRLTGAAPDQVLPIVAEIYFDPSEDYEKRIAAFRVLLKCQPPLTMLERIMTELHQENSNQVGSYVYSLCSELANSSLPYDRKMAQKLQLVLPHAPDFDIGSQYSSSYMYTFYDDDNDYGLKAQSHYVASNVSQIPRYFSQSIRYISGPYREDLVRIGGSIKGADEFIDKLFQPGGIATQILSSLGSNVQVRNIHEVLDIVKSRLLFKDPDVDIPKATFYYKLLGRTTYLTLDEEYAIEVIEQVLSSIREIDASSGFSANYAKIWMPDSFIHAVPSAIGFPVVISHRHPVVFTASLENSRVATSPKKEAPLTATIAASTDIHISLHVASIAMAAVIDPANDQVHGVAVEQKTEAAFAAEVQFAFNSQQDTFALSVKPKLPHKIFYHDTRPVTFIKEAAIIGEPKEEWLDQVNEIETVPEPFKFEKRHEGRALGLSLRLSGDSENPWGDIPLPLSDTAEDDGLVAAALEAFVNPEMTNRELHIYLEPHHKSPASEIVWTVDYDKHLKIGLPSGEEDEEESSEEEDYEKALSSIYGPSYAVPDAQATIKKLFQKTQATWTPVLGQGYEEPVPATVAHVLEVTMGIKGQHPKQHAWRGVYAHSLDFRSNVFELVGHRSSDEHEGPWQLCASAAVLYPQLPNPFYLEMNTLKSQQVKIQGESGWGRDCQSDNKIRLEGVIEKSEQQLTSSSGVYDSPKDQQSLPWYFKQCQVDRTEGQTQSYACQQAISEDSQLRKIKLEFIADEVPESLQNLTYKADLLAKYEYYANLEANPFVSNEDDRVTIIVHYSEQVPEIPLLDIEVHKPKESLVFSKLFWPAFEPLSTLDSYEEVLMDQYYDDDYIPSCDVMEDYLVTFDNVTIELPDNKCQYILAHDTSPDKAFTIIASQIDLEAKTKALSMSLVGHSIKALPPRGEAVPVVVDGKQHELTPETPIVMDFDKDNEVRIYVRSTSSSTDTPVLVIEAYDANIIVFYDGKNSRIKMPREYQGDQAGACGDFNDEEYQEFTGPNGCQYVLEEDFINSYAIPGQSCSEPPKPEGPAFCPDEVVSKQERNQQRKPQQDSDESEPQPRPPRRPHQPRPTHPEESEEEPPTSYRPKTPKRPAKPSPSKDSDEEPAPSRRQQPADSEESEESDKPSGRPECVQEYTPSFENKAKQATCFSTRSTYKCQSGCSPSGVKKQELPFHCIPKGTYEVSLKEQARQGPVPQLQNKKPDFFKEVEIPGQCL